MSNYKVIAIGCKNSANYVSKHSKFLLTHFLFEIYHLGHFGCAKKKKKKKNIPLFPLVSFYKFIANNMLM